MNNTLPINKNLSFKHQNGFTLIELLVVLGILVVLLTVTLVAVNPSFQFAQANDVRRQSDINAILNAVNAYSARNGGSLPAAIPSTPTNIGSGVSDVDICDEIVDLYIAEMPVDPVYGDYVDCDDYDTQYDISTFGVNGRIRVTASNSDLDGELEAVR